MVSPVDSRVTDEQLQELIDDTAEALMHADAEIEAGDLYPGSDTVRRYRNMAVALDELKALRLSATARDEALRSAERALRQCYTAFFNNIHSPAAHDRYACIAKVGLDAVSAILAQEDPPAPQPKDAQSLWPSDSDRWGDPS